jgi:hypothetical protein
MDDSSINCNDLIEMFNTQCAKYNAVMSRPPHKRNLRRGVVQQRKNTPFFVIVKNAD